MLMKDVLPRLRRERGLTQEELARRLYITRQAVSRWECGETSPGIDMIKLIARELNVPITELLDMPEHYCQSCGMMFTGPDQHGHEADGAETERYCRWCYEGGAYTYETTMDEMIEDCAPRMAEYMGWTVDECASLLGAVLPTLERWRGGLEGVKGTVARVDDGADRPMRGRKRRVRRRTVGFAHIDARLLAHPGATKAFHEKWGWDGLLGWATGSLPASFTAGPDAKPPYAGRHLLSLKCDPDRIRELRAEYPDAVLPGYYSDGRTWISVDFSGPICPRAW